MLKLRVRLVKDDGTTDATSRVLNALEIDYTPFLNAAGALKFKVSRKTFTPLVEPFVVRVEYAINDGVNVPRFQPVPEHDLFIVEEDSDDSKDAAEVVSYTATPFVPWLLAGAYVGTGQWEKDGERTINGDGALTNAGQVMAFFIDESKSRGWLTPLLRGFNSLVDSAGASWTEADRTSIAWRLETFYPRILEQLTEQGWCDWSTQGRTLHLYRHGTRGTDRSQEIVLGGPDFERVPVKTDITGWYTHVLGLSDAGRVHVTNAGAEARFGRRSAVMTQTGVKDTTTSTKLAQTLLADGQTVKREEAYEWTPQEGGLHPFRDFRLGDLVTARSRGGKLPRRVIGMVVRQGTGPATVQVRVGEKISTLAAQNRKKLASVAVGGVQGGNGGAFPTSPGLPNAVPDAPDAVMVASNTGAWREDGTAVSTVVLSWEPVTAATDGAEIDVTSYEVWSRLPSGQLALDTIVTGPTATITSWEPGTLRLAVVYAVSARGARSAASLEVPVTPAMPSSIVPKPPTGLTATSNVGAFTPAGAVATVVLEWDPVTESTDDEPITVAEYEVWADDAPQARVPGPTAVLSVPSDLTRDVRVLAITSQGVRGDLSDVYEVTGAKPSTASRAPTAPDLATGYGDVVARWDGLYTGGGAGSHTVWTEARLDPGDPWVRQGVAMTGRGDQLVTLGDPNDTVYVRFVAYDQLGRETGVSTVADIVIATIPGAAITAGSIEVDRLGPNVGDTINISGNVTIGGIMDRADGQDVALGQLGDQIDTVAGAADDAASQAALAQAQAAVVAGQVLVAQATADNAAAGVSAYQDVILLGSDGITIREAVDGRSELRLRSGYLAFSVNGVEASRMEAGRFISGEAILGQARIGEHEIKRHSAQRTIITPI